MKLNGATERDEKVLNALSNSILMSPPIWRRELAVRLVEAYIELTKIKNGQLTAR